MSSTNTRFISTSTVEPAKNHHHQNERIHLTPWDLQLLMANPIQRGLLFHKPQDTSTFMQHLKATLSQTLDEFYPLAGRLSMIQNDDETSFFHLNCSGEGVPFVHAVADHGIKVADILDPFNIPHHILHSFFPLNGTLNYHGVSKPLLAVQVTELEDGIFIACTVNHSVADGTCFWHFFNTWSRISRATTDDQIEVSQTPLVFSRQFLDGVVELPVPVPLTVENSAPNPTPPLQPLEHRMFHFSKQRIAQLKAKANAEMGTDKISSLQALMGHLWVWVTRNRNLDPDQDIAYIIMIGMRNRMEPKLAEEYLGNAAMIGFVKTTAGQLLKRGSGWAASRINNMIASQTYEGAKKWLENWAKNPTGVTRPNSGQLIVDSTKLITGSSSRFDVYGNDFGWGKPVAVRTGPGNRADGKLTVFSGAEDGSIDFEACFLPHTLRALVHDAQFIESLPI